MIEIDASAASPGAFFLKPEGDGPWPAVVLLGGSEGDDMVARARGERFAALGYGAFGLPYHSPVRRSGQRFSDLPSAFAHLPVERVKAALDWLAARDDVRADRIAFYGFSKGAELALLASSLIGGAAAVVGVTPSDVVWEGWGSRLPPGSTSSFSWEGRPLDFVPYGDIGAEFAKFGRGDSTASLRRAHERGRNSASAETIEAARIPVERIAAPLLLAAGAADNVWPAAEMARNIAERRSAAGLDTRLMLFPHAGHNICGEGLRPLGTAPTAAADRDSQRLLWAATIDFMDEVLNR